MTDVRIARALLSVSDKSGLIPFARRLTAAGVEILSTGGTARAIAEAGIAVVEVSERTGFPEIMDGRVKTLHPTIHGGILARRDDGAHVQAMAAHDIRPIDLVAINLYPFEETVSRGAGFAECVENVDIGGPAMIRAAAKNHQFVAVATDPRDYEAILSDMDRLDGAVSLDLRRRLAADAFARTAAYDAAIAGWFAVQNGVTFPARMGGSGVLKQTLRYGENPHQEAAMYLGGRARPGVATATQVQGKELSYNNINDTDAAFELVSEFADPTVAVIKHANPCGVASAGTMVEAYRRAHACDPVSAFGGIVALNRPLDEATAKAIAEIFVEVVIAPGADAGARALFEKKRNLRLLLTEGLADPGQPGVQMKTIAGGFLVQGRDDGRVTRERLKVVTRRAPTDAEIADMLFAFTVAKHVKSNAIVYARDARTVGVGAGQMSRVDSSRMAAMKSAEYLGTAGSVVASDAFFPFADGLLAAVEAGATAVIQPGGSIRDEEVIAAADEKGVAMVFTGMRHFRH